MRSSLWFDASMLALILLVSVVIAAADKAAAKSAARTSIATVEWSAGDQRH